jgi:predicted nuclease of predicted toxin-antitoxin system
VKFLVDEDVAIEIARCLEHEGHEVRLVAQTLGAGTDDAQIWDFAVRDKLILITCNRQDFLKLAGTNPATGLVILNRRTTRQSECRHVLRLLASATEQGLRGNINFA